MAVDPAGFVAHGDVRADRRDGLVLFNERLAALRVFGEHGAVAFGAVGGRALLGALLVASVVFHALLAAGTLFRQVVGVPCARGAQGAVAQE